MIVELLIVIGAVGAVYSYFLYPAVLMILRDNPTALIDTAEPGPRLTIIVAARNERRRIRRKLEETIALRENYSGLEILVASDASDDGTDDIVREFAADGVRLVRTEERNGKEFAQREAIRAATGEIIMFTDAGTTIVTDSIGRLVTLFADPSIGAVSSTDRIINEDGSVSGEGLYIRYEMWLRELESRKVSLIGLSGSFFAATRDVCRLWDTDIPSDLAVAINTRILGLRAVSDRAVIGEYRDTRNPDHEFQRKIRTIVRGMTAIARKREVLNPFRFGKLAFQLWSHKVLRWAVPWFGACYTAGALAAVSSSSNAWPLLAPVVAVLLLSALGALSTYLRRLPVVGASFFFVQVNLAALFAALQFVGGRRVTMWAPTAR